MIRDITTSDIKHGLHLMEEAKAESPVYCAFNLDGDQAAGALAYYIADHNCYARLSEAPNGCAGFLLASLDVSPWIDVIVAQIDMFYVRPNVRGKGIGVRLLRDFMHWARLQEAHVVTWSPWGAIDDEPTAALVARMGFRDVGRNYLLTQ